MGSLFFCHGQKKSEQSKLCSDLKYGKYFWQIG